MLGFDEVGDGIDKLVAGVNDDLCWLKRVVVRVHHIRRR
jgi:hypothetical protein